MRKTLVIGLTVVMAVSILVGCIGDEPETTVTVTRERSSDSENEKRPVTPQNLPENLPENLPQSPPQNPPQSPPPSMDLEEPTPEEEESAKRIALEDERVQDLIQGSDYELQVIGCRFLPSGEKICFLLLELESGEVYTIVVNLSIGTVMDVREGEITERSKGEGGNE